MTGRFIRLSAGWSVLSGAQVLKVARLGQAGSVLKGNTMQEIALLTLILFQSCKDTYRLSVSLEPAGIGHATVERSLKKRVLVEPNRRALVTSAKATPR